MPVTRGSRSSSSSTASTRGSDASAGSRSGREKMPGLVRVAVDPALVDLRRVVVADQQRRDPDGAVERARRRPSTSSMSSAA